MRATHDAVLSGLKQACYGCWPGTSLMKLPRRHFLQLAGAVFAAPALPRRASALDYPARPVRIVVPVPPGGALDIVARLIGQKLSERLAQPFVIENRPGAGTNIGVEAVVHAAADGYTLLLIPPSVTVNATLYKLNFNFIRDIVPIAMIGQLPLVMEVSLPVPATTVPEFIAYAKANPGKVNMASGGSGSPSHIVGELFMMMTGASMVHAHRSDGRSGAGDVQSFARVDCQHQSRQGARAGGNHRAALAVAAGCAERQ
jgi:tripartite-type tricarboxylate transporter receptor subunit TctC